MNLVHMLEYQRKRTEGKDGKPSFDGSNSPVNDWPV